MFMLCTPKKSFSLTFIDWNTVSGDLEEIFSHTLNFVGCILTFSSRDKSHFSSILVLAMVNFCEDAYWDHLVAVKHKIRNQHAAVICKILQKIYLRLDLFVFNLAFSFQVEKSFVTWWRTDFACANAADNLQTCPSIALYVHRQGKPKEMSGGILYCALQNHPSPRSTATIGWLRAPAQKIQKKVPSERYQKD